MKDRKKMAHISVQQSQKEKTDEFKIQGESNDKTLLRESCLVHPQEHQNIRFIIHTSSKN